MAEIFEFPTREVRDWAEAERIIRDSLNKLSDASLAMTTEICERMKNFWDMSQRPLGNPILEFPYLEYLEPAKGNILKQTVLNFIDSIVRDLHEVMAEIMMDRLRLEVELYRLRSER